jgi:hypothetical protein
LIFRLKAEATGFSLDSIYPVGFRLPASAKATVGPRSFQRRGQAEDASDNQDQREREQYLLH